eukprot:3402160-Amphidinium_carterae.1
MPPAFLESPVIDLERNHNHLGCNQEAEVLGRHQRSVNCVCDHEGARCQEDGRYDAGNFCHDRRVARVEPERNI